jgi:Uma2 family endonuclease
MSGTANNGLGSTPAGEALEENVPVSVPISGPGIPILYEDEGHEGVGESDVHTRTGDILFYGLKFHLAGQSRHCVFWNLNLFYSLDRPAAHVSPDIMVVDPPHNLPDDLAAYRIGQEGPAPVLALEILSGPTAQPLDLTDKPIVYAALGVAEYILVDVTGQFLPGRLLIKRLPPFGDWINEQDADGGVTSRLGFRLVIEPDGQVRVRDSATGKRYARPEEAETEAEARRQAEKRIAELVAELSRLRQSLLE